MKKQYFIAGLASVAALSMAACNQSGEKAAGDAGAEASGSAATGAPAAVEAPAPGLWRVTTAMTGPAAAAGAIPPQEVCVTATDKLEAPSTSQAGGGECTSTPFANEGGAKVSTSTCKLPGNITSESTVRISGDFSKKYTTEVTTKMTPAPTPEMAETKITMTSERIGDCPAA